MSNTLSDGRKIRLLTALDPCTRECPAIHVGSPLTGDEAARILERLAETRGDPNALRTDNRPERTGRILDLWA